METSDGNFEIFDFGIDAIKTIVVPSARDVNSRAKNFGAGGPTLRDGNFIWTTKRKEEITEIDAFGKEKTSPVDFFSTQMISICSSMQFFNEDTLKCEACP